MLMMELYYYFVAKTVFENDVGERYYIFILTVSTVQPKSEIRYHLYLCGWVE